MTPTYKMCEWRSDDRPPCDLPIGHQGPHSFASTGHSFASTRQPTGSGDFSIGSVLWPGVSKLIEEVGELGQVLGKLIAVAGETKHWSGNLREKLVEEIGDVYAALDFVVYYNFGQEETRQIRLRREKKLATFTEWHRNPKPPT